MSSATQVTLSRRETTVLIDVFNWALTRNADTAENNTMGAGSEETSVSDETLEAVVDALEAEQTLPLGQITPRTIGNLMEAYADALESQAWDIDNSQATFEFYEATFQSIEEQLKDTTRQAG